ncbi:MAG: DUF2459 domain-containing protein [Pseudomonadota bacterium]|jgi:uncharacterized protein (TIGR02117 family)
MKASTVYAVALAGILAGSACAAPQRLTHPPADEPVRPVYVVSHGWHTGLVLRVADIPEAVWPVRRDFPQAKYVEVGWGDRGYYMAPEPDAWLAAKALLWPTPGVLHVVGFSEATERAFPASDIVELGIGAQGIERLSAYVRASYELDAAGKPIPLGAGLYGDSRFYASRERFHLFKTCNVWTIRALAEAGVPVTPGAALTADSLLGQLRPHGRAMRSGAQAPR